METVTTTLHEYGRGKAKDLLRVGKIEPIGSGFEKCYTNEVF